MKARTLLTVAAVPLSAMFTPAFAEVVYTRLPPVEVGGPNDPLRGNYDSLNPQATGGTAWGDHLTLANSNRWIDGGSVILSNWSRITGPTDNPFYFDPTGRDPAGYNFSLTISFFDVDTSGADPVAGNLLGARTIGGFAPWKPADWPNPLGGQFNGIAFEFDFSFADDPVFVGDDVIVLFNMDRSVSGDPQANLNIAIPHDLAGGAVLGLDADTLFSWDLRALGPAPIDNSGEAGITPYLELTAAAAPEPGTVALFAGLAAIGFAAWRRRQR